jgi:tetratricopeptide (TPR) repeat protein
MGVHTLMDGGSGWTVVEPPNWCRDDLRVLLELVPERPTWLVGGPPRELEEALGLELWRAVANIRLWADTPKPERAELFQRIRAWSPAPGDRYDLPDPTLKRRADARASEPELVPALAVFSALTEAPDRISVSDVAAACRVVVAWAEQRGFTETAMQFAEAAAAAAPESPVLANLAGRICRAYGKRGRAELWYDRAIGLSRRTPGKLGIREYIHAHLGFATTLLEAEDHPRALKYIKRAGLMAKRKGMRAKAAESFHDALALAVLDGTYARAAIYARKAFSLYPFHHKRFPAFAYDLAFLMVSMGLYARALSLLQSVARKVEVPAEALVVWGTLARAAAGAGQRIRFNDAVEVVERMVMTYQGSAPAALYSVAEGARLLGDWSMAASYAARACHLAREAGSVQVLRRAEHLVTEINQQLSGTPKMNPQDARGRIVFKMAAAVRLRLAKWRGSTWRPRRRLSVPEWD